jgi:hypothetical protein
VSMGGSGFTADHAPYTATFDHVRVWALQH